MDNTFFWVVSAVLVLLVELNHPGLFFFLSFCVGSLGAACAAYGAASFVVQLFVFCILSTITFLSLKRWVSCRQPGGYRTNMYALPGAIGRVIDEITPVKAGRVKIGGELWSARALHHETLAALTCVEIVKVQGTHVIVQRIKEKS